MQIFTSIIINLIILAVLLPLFYIYIAYKLRDKLEKEAVNRARIEIEGIVKEFNNTALSNITLLEDIIERSRDASKELNNSYEFYKEIEKSDFLKKISYINNISTDSKTSFNRINSDEEKINTKPIITKIKETPKSIEVPIPESPKNSIQLVSNDSLDNDVKKVYQSEAIINLYDSGLSEVEIANKLGLSITEIELAIEMSKHN